MLASNQPDEVPSSQLRSVSYDLEHQRTYVSPQSDELDSLLQTRRLTAFDDPEHGYRLDKQPVSMLGPANVIANAGLGLVAALVLAEQGDAVEVPPAKQGLAEATGPTRNDENPHVIELIQANRHGLIRHRLGAIDLGHLCAETAERFPGATIAIVEASGAQAARLHAELRARLSEPVTWADADRCVGPGARIIVGTFAGLGQMEVLGDQIDILIVMDASQAAGVNVQLAMLGNGRCRLVGFLHQDKLLPPFIRDLVMAAFGPCEVTVPRLGYQYRHVATDWRRVDGPIVPDHLAGYRLYRHGIEKHRVRNRCIADYAKLIAAHPAHQRHSNATIITVGGLEHALELAKLLPTWRMMVNEPVNLAGLSLKQCRRFEASRSVPAGEGHAIVTVPALHQIDLGGIGNVLWAAAGSGLPEVSREQLICPAGEQQPLLWVDIRDGQHGQLRRLSKLREKAYTAAGWFPVGQSPLEGRIRRFLAQRPGGIA